VSEPGRLPAQPGRDGLGSGEAGASLVEAIVAAAIAIIIGAAAVPPMLNQRDSIHAAGAARHIAALAHLARAEAVRRGVNVALVFQPDGSGFRLAVFADGNYDGVRSADIAGGIDRQVTPWVGIGDQFPKAAFGIVPGTADPDSGTPLSGSPLKLGGSALLSFGCSGGATSGTIYLRGPGNQQYALRVLGATGRSRLLRFDFKERQWVAA
jgi:type II secretory pathway pseudopilin PulG